MKIIICGAGQVGGQIARHLAREEGANQVTVIDKDAALIRRITDAYDVNGVVGFASHPDILERAGARDADMVIAATQSDEVNMVVCQVANSIFSVPRKIARLRAPAYLNAIYSDLYRRDHLPIDVVISPEYAVADAVMQRLAAPAAFDIEGFLDDKAQLVGITLDTRLRGARTRRCASSPSSSRRCASSSSACAAAERLFVPEPSDQLYAERPGLSGHRHRGPAAGDGGLRQAAPEGRAAADRRRRQHRPARGADPRGRRPRATG